MRTKKGVVVSAKSNKTAVVLVHTSKMHPVLKKAFRVSKKFHAHDENNECKNGDEVLISETKPISKLKHWKLEKIIKKAALVSKIKDEEILGDISTDKIEQNEVAKEENIKNSENLQE